MTMNVRKIMTMLLTPRQMMSRYRRKDFTDEEKRIAEAEWGHILKASGGRLRRICYGIDEYHNMNHLVTDGECEAIISEYDGCCWVYFKGDGDGWVGAEDLDECVKSAYPESEE